MTQIPAAAIEAAGIAYAGGTDAWFSADDLQKKDVEVILTAACPAIRAQVLAEVERAMKGTYFDDSPFSMDAGGPWTHVTREGDKCYPSLAALLDAHGSEAQ